MPGETTYNGWTNYSTWAVALWLDNDSYNAGNVFAHAWLDRSEDGGTVSDLADDLRAYVRGFPEVETVEEKASLVADLLGYALAQVDWYELALAYVTEELRQANSDDPEAELERRRQLFLATALA